MPMWVHMWKLEAVFKTYSSTSLHCISVSQFLLLNLAISPPGAGSLVFTPIVWGYRHVLQGLTFIGYWESEFRSSWLIQQTLCLPGNEYYTLMILLIDLI